MPNLLEYEREAITHDDEEEDVGLAGILYHCVYVGHRVIEPAQRCANVSNYKVQLERGQFSSRLTSYIWYYVMKIFLLIRMTYEKY